MGRRNPLGAKGSDSARGPRRHRPRAERRCLDGFAAAVGVDGSTGCPRRANAVAPEVARTELVRRWLWAFGPATVTDIKWWFGNTLTWARQALRDIDAVEVDLDGTPGFALPDDLEVEPDAEPWCALLPGLDVTTMGWFDRDWYLGGHRSQVFDTNGNGGPTIWCNGRIVGGWAQHADGRVELQLLEDVGRDAKRALTRRADELAEWLGGVRVSARFPSPLTRAVGNSQPVTKP